MSQVRGKVSSEQRTLWGGWCGGPGLVLRVQGGPGVETWLTDYR